MDDELARRLLEDASKELTAARVRVVQLEQVVEGLTGLLGDMRPDAARELNDKRYNYWVRADGSRDVKPREAVLAALKQRPGRLLTAREIYEHLEQAGLVNPEVRSGIAAYDMALRRLADEGNSGVERDESTNRYIYRPARPKASSSRGVVDASGRVVIEGDESSRQFTKTFYKAGGGKQSGSRGSEIQHGAEHDGTSR